MRWSFDPQTFSWAEMIAGRRFGTLFSATEKTRIILKSQFETEKLINSNKLHYMQSAELALSAGTLALMAAFQIDGARCGACLQ